MRINFYMCNSTFKMASTVHSVLDNNEWNYYDLKNFLESDASTINDLDLKQDLTPLHKVLMSDKCSLDMVTLMLQYGADVKLESTISSALSIALMCHKNKDIIRVLLEAGADVNAIDGYYIMPPLCMALRSGASAEVIELLLESGCPVDNSGEYSSILHCATNYQLKADVCKLLLQAGAGDVNKLDGYGESILCHALCKGAEVEAIKMLMDAGCSLTACMEHESAWLCATAFSSMLKGNILNVLLEAGIDITPVNTNNETPLQCALRYCVYDTSAIELLFNLQVGKVAKSRMDKSLLLDAMSNYACKLSTVKLLIDRKVKVDVVNDFGATLLHLVLRHNPCSPDIIKYLLEKGAPVNKKNCYGDTPLRIAVENGYKMSILQLLLEGGAYIHMQNDHKVPMLRLILTQYHLNTSQEEYHDILKMFLKYTFLENINFEMETINLNYDVFWGFARECVRELRDMKLKDIGCFCVLHELIDRDVESDQDVDSDPDVKSKIVMDIPDDRDVESKNVIDIQKYDFNLILEVLRNNKYPVYFDVICSNIGRNAMLSELSKVRLFTITSSPVWPYVQSKVMLNCECVARIVQFLSSESDVMNLMIAFSFPRVSSN